MIVKMEHKRALHEDSLTAQLFEAFSDSLSNIDSLLQAINSGLLPAVFSDAEKDSLRNMAASCALEWGRFVYLARAAVAGFDTTLILSNSCKLPAGVSDTVYQAFYTKCLNLPMGRQEQVWQQLNSTAVDSLTLDSFYAHYADSLFSPYAGDDGLSQYFIDSLMQAIDSLANQAMLGMEQQRISSALAENNTLTTVHPAEEFYKDVLEVYGNTWASGNYVLTASDSSVLNDVAFLSPSDAGDAVYIARMLLDTLLHDPLPPARYGEVVQRKTEPSYTVNVFPNPAGASVTVKIIGEVTFPVQVKIIDFSGRVVQQQMQAVTEQQYSLDNLAAGAYLYEIQNTAGLLQRGKLILNHP